MAGFGTVRGLLSLLHLSGRKQQSTVSNNPTVARAVSKAPISSMQMGKKGVIPFYKEAFAHFHATEWAEERVDSFHSMDRRPLMSRTRLQSANPLNSGSVIQNHI